MTHFTATAQRDGRWWMIQCDQYPSALSQVGRLDRAEEVHREAIAFVAGVPEESVEVTITPALDHEVAEALRESEELRAEAEDKDRKASTLKREAARKLANSGLTVRDIGIILGVSYQRAHQLIAAPDNTSGGHRRLAS
ncbi:hypothetical protein DFQ14_110161 [Halopolyspora algeriensis]|uniref:Sigma-70-like protein n=1 Tax=Halopolyspora algeriensis TaxID=1500506 RepID=A0A368VJY8_9ACTN|nr:type II toxin-antitoxin system HicB family antitoxin [Halopolyspora algeriensis]RCW40832.1 hypothetical protein DFQ14_110161 [Halopolyspora algeriensis]TQM53250.1 hypothetical protein FHU43_2636 [Halopolyspora algeriensis]